MSPHRDKYIFNNIGVRELVYINLLKMNVPVVYQSAEFYYRVLRQACPEDGANTKSCIFVGYY